MVCQSFQRAEGRQINGGLAQRLDCPVYQVRGITHRRGRLDHARHHQLLAALGVDRGLEIDAHRPTIVVERRLPSGITENRRHGGQRELRRQMRNGIDMDFERGRK